MSKEEKTAFDHDSLASRIARVEQGLANLEVIARLSDDKAATVRHIRERLEAIRESLHSGASGDREVAGFGNKGLASLESQISKELEAFEGQNPSSE